MSRIAIVALAMGEPKHAISMTSLNAASNPIERAAFINEFASWHAGATRIAQVVGESNDGLFVSAVILAFGNIPVDLIPESDHKEWRALIALRFQDDPDSGVHSAAGWTLRRWGIETPNIVTDRSQKTQRRWQVTPTGLTLLQVDRPETDLKSAAARFWIADRETSVRIFQRFIEDEVYPGETSIDWPGPNEGVSPTDGHPVQSVNWMEAVMFCNWLSFKEGLRPYYVHDENGEWDVDDDSLGYRLPSDTEWELACRAGTTTTYSCGDDTFLNQYALFRREDHADVCGTKMCNAWGFFDMHGNVWEWVGEVPDEVVSGRTGVQQDIKGQPNANPQPTVKALRGGSRGAASVMIRSDSRTWHLPTHRSLALGFRVARTIEP